MVNEQMAIEIIEDWFKNRCNGRWEHQFGLRLETTDNPGWLMTFDDLDLADESLAKVIGALLAECGVQVATDGSIVRVYAPSMRGCLSGAATLIGLAKSH